MQNDDIRLSQYCSNLASFSDWIVYIYTFWLSNAASAAVGEPCNSLGLVAHRPEWCCVGFSVMGQNGPSCGTQTINTLLWSALHISYPHKQHHTTWHTKTPTCIHTNSFSHFYSLAHENMHNFTNDSRRGGACLSRVQQTECCHMVESSTTDESCRDCAHMQTGTQGDGETKRKRDAERKKENWEQC